MPICEQCEDQFPNRVIIEGKVKIINTRKYCLTCSPYGEHNTKKFGKEKSYSCRCGEKNPDKFYGHKSGRCITCHNLSEMNKRKENKKYAVERLGGRCKQCGFDEFMEGLCFHHKDPSKKDSDFKNFAQWSRKRINTELEDCELYCLRCHAGVHAGYYGM